MIVLRVLAALAVAALAACAGTDTSEISATNRHAFIPSARVSVDISPRDETPSRPHTGHAVEAGVSGGRGHDTQSLGTGANPVVFGGQTFNTPNQLTHEFEFRYYDLAYRYRKLFGADQSFGIEGLAGVAYADLKLTVASSTQSASDKLGNGGFAVGAGGIWRFLPSTSLQARLMLFASGKREGVTDASRFDVYLAQALGRNAALHGGFSSWDVRSERQSSNNLGSVNSPIHVRFSGPALGLDVMF